MVQIANMIELGQIRAGIVVGTEERTLPGREHDRIAQRHYDPDSTADQDGDRVADHRLGKLCGAAGRIAG